ncbi:laminin subunit alpha-3-like [Xyrichtys novacula]|uniref:Laminin subunit alpha-3-like n=1 Tax=Xyrichtys novacula TaxID=13765 RepID=A0AAV1GFV8_XYRNO|nr:laminin subunit alpha-3-like [Xyrichtys novacula]
MYAGINIEPGVILNGNSGQYCISKFIESGTFGKVVKATNVITRESVALKIMNNKDKDIIANEIEILQTLRTLDADKSNIVQFFETFEHNGHTCLAFEMLDKSLFDLMIENCVPFSLHEIRSVAQQLLSAFDAMGDIGIIYTDLKLENVMLVNQRDQPFRVKLIDFGLSVKTSEAHRGLGIPAASLRAPEVFLGLPSSEAIDMWALGCLLFTMFLLDFPFGGDCSQDVIMKNIVAIMGQPDDHLLDAGKFTACYFVKNASSKHPKWLVKEPETCKLRVNSLEDLVTLRPENHGSIEIGDRRAFVSLLKGLLNTDPEKRISPKQALSHPFITMVHLLKNGDSQYLVDARDKMVITYRNRSEENHLSPAAVEDKQEEPAEAEAAISSSAEEDPALTNISKENHLGPAAVVDKQEEPAEAEAAISSSAEEEPALTNISEENHLGPAAVVDKQEEPAEAEAAISSSAVEAPALTKINQSEENVFNTSELVRFDSDAGLVKAIFRETDGQDTGFSLSPPYFNLAQGASISASATCGQDEAGIPRNDLYCKLVGGPTTGVLTQNIQGQFCDVCNSADPTKAHPVTNAIDGTERWWQSPPLSRGPGYNEVTVTLDLGQLFHVAYVLIKFANSPRPDLWVLERSVDYGRTFNPWQYFAHSKRECIERFGKQPNVRVLNDDDQLCTTEYSRIVPLENGEIVVSLVNGRPGSKNFTYSPVLRDFTKATNIRLRFLRTSTLLGHLISKAQRDPTVTRRYFYSIKDVSIGGRCVCHGHAQVCGGGRDRDNPNRLQCECQHNTCGESCDRCCPGFNQKPWRAATVDSPNECQPCQCFSHAFDCYYNPEVEKRGASLDTFGRYDGGGVCINCQHNTAGVNCEQCVEGFYRPYGVPPESPSGCIPCRCDDRTTAGCEMGSGRCICKPQFAGGNCERCADGYYYYPECIPYPVYQTTTKSPAGPIVVPTACPTGYFGSPSCQQCICDYRGTTHRVCDAAGRCLCRQGVEGERCDRCQLGYHSFPNCQVCLCDGAGASENACSPSGQCACLPNYVGERCDECAPGYYGYPDCAACRCTQEGSYGNVCNQLSGQCLCLPGVVGQQCDRCASGLRFPQCSAPISSCNLAGTEFADPLTGSCRCRTNVEGTQCDRCKPLYWSLAPDNPHGCIECQCDLKGTLSGVGECEQKKGQCHCKPNACGLSCDTCKDGFYLLQKKKYFGCQGCECDVGGAISMACDEMSGQCQCRKNVVGLRCTEPAPNYYFPTLHQLKYEVEDGTTPNARPVRFGYNPEEFPGFSWRGYAVMSPAQSEVRVTVHVDPKDGRQHLFRVVLRFTNPTSTSVTGSIKATNNRGAAGSEQSKEVIFPQSRSPSFLTVPGEGFAEPFALTPGKWIIHIRAEGVLLDYLVLLPRDYYEAPLLQEKVTEPCTYLTSANRDANCLLYKHVAIDGFSSALGSQGVLSNRNGRRKRQARVRRPTPDHPEMAALNGRQSQLQLSLRVPRPGPYILVLEYASEVDAVQNVNILISGQTADQIPARANVYSCAYSFLCRSVAVDGSNQVSVLQLTHKTDVLLQTSTTSFLLYKVYAIPAEEFSMEFVDPKVLCVSTHGRFTEDSRHCIQSHFEKPTSAFILYAARDGQLSPAPAVSTQREENEVWRLRRQTIVSPDREPQSEGVLLKFPQTEINFIPKVPLPDRYVVVVHYHQPEHTSFPVEVRVDAGREWKGSINVSFCPAVSGCREVVIAEGRIAFDLEQNSWQQPTIVVSVPQRKTLILDYIMLVPDSSYTPDLLKGKPLDKSADFIEQCRGEGFFVDPRTSSQFCTDAARSLVAAYNDGALPCNCDQTGSTGTSCDPVGGQCPCRQHVIGRQCTKCATGYYGFPYCRPCECGRRLCDEVTGSCICPPQTLKPACDVCQTQTFSYHPLLGCEDCECSPNGIKTSAGPDCDRITGQCNCKPRIGGRQCDRCAPGYYRFPDCIPCNCKRGGVTADICHPDTGRCLCKKNVAGIRCDSCREGSFFFDTSNPQGCTSCFCFGATDRCQSSSKRRGKFVEMQGWRLERPNQEEVPTVLNSASNTVVADIQELPSTVQTLHWVAPAAYLGNKVSSYGGFLTYQSKSFGIPSEGMTLMDRRPDVVLNGQSMTLIHMALQVPQPDRLYQGRVQFLEGNWRHAITNQPVSREELMMVLSNLVGLRIRALYFTQTQRLGLGEVGLEGATDTGTGGPGNTVEDCSCPPQYSGDSCEKCSPGFYRDSSGPYLGQCRPCECNGLTDECEDKTGRCLNCKHNTAGDRCERCKDGYYGNAGKRTCRICPCPFSLPSNNFAVGCKDLFGDLQCVCSPGYAGDRCERCAPGFYGDPLTVGGSCKRCNCNGNGNNCDPRTGVCKNTLEPGDTNTDDQCKECDNCAQTLLNDLEKLDIELVRIRAQMDNATASATSQDRLKKLETAIADTKILVNKFTSTINSEKTKVNQLEEDTVSLSDDISSLKEKADKKADDADKAVAEVDKTHKKAKELDSEIQNMLKKIKALLDQLKENNSGDTVPNENLATMLEDAERMVNEMEKRNFTPQKTSAEKERDEAKKLLDYIKGNVSKQCDQNEAAAEKIRDLLEGYEDKLKDLDDALKEASELVKKANTQNGLNAQALKDLQKRIEDLKNERKTVEGQINLAEDELQKTEDLVKELTDSKTEYEQLAAQLDGAKTDLTKKVNEIAKAAAQEDLVERAEEHAKKLAKLAKDLEDSVKDASGRSEVKNAKDAIDAYKNIVDAIKAAEAAAKEAKGAADNALDNVKNQKLKERAKTLKDTGDGLLQSAKEPEKDLKDAKDDLADLKKRLADAETKKKALQNDLTAAENQLNDINREEIADMIDNAKKMTTDASETTKDTMNRLDDIKKELAKINVPSGDSDSGDALDDADKSVKDLLKTIPSLSDKISEVETLATQFTPINNITDNIKKIKELIEQARDAANRIVVPMKFEGNGHVELRPPRNLDDLKAYTAMSLSLQRPEGRGDGRRRRRQTAGSDDMFVMYLGNKKSPSNYIGMALRNNVLYGYYKVNGVENELMTGPITRSKDEPAKFDKVDLNRIYQDAELNLLKYQPANQDGTPIKDAKKGQQKENLLDLDPDDVVFYVGGYPDDFTPPASLNLPKYTGCIELTSFNNYGASLYNFKSKANINPKTPCKRYVPPLDSEYYEGTGYSKAVSERSYPVLVFLLNLHSRSENGLLLYVRSEGDYITVTLEKGMAVIRSNLLGAPATNSIKLSPTENLEGISIIISNKEAKVLQGRTALADAKLAFGSAKVKDYYIGGAPRDLREKDNISMQPFKGCLKNLKQNGNVITAKEQVGVRKGCPMESLVTRAAEFSLKSTLSADLPGFSLANDITVSLGFKSTQDQGLILQDKQQDIGINLSLENGHVVLTFNDKIWKSNNKYNDDKWHYLTVTKTAGRVSLLIDDVDEGQEQSGTGSITGASLGTMILGKDTFQGCMSNLYTRRPTNLYKAEDLSVFSSSGDVFLDVCTADSPVQLMLDSISRKR